MQYIDENIDIIEYTQCLNTRNIMMKTLIPYMIRNVLIHAIYWWRYWYQRWYRISEHTQHNDENIGRCQVAVVRLEPTGDLQVQCVEIEVCVMYQQEQCALTFNHATGCIMSWCVGVIVVHMTLYRPQILLLLLLLFFLSIYPCSFTFIEWYWCILINNKLNVIIIITRLVMRFMSSTV